MLPWNARSTRDTKIVMHRMQQPLQAVPRELLVLWLLCMSPGLSPSAQGACQLTYARIY